MKRYIKALSFDVSRRSRMRYLYAVAVDGSKTTDCLLSIMVFRFHYNAENKYNHCTIHFPLLKRIT